MNTAFDIITDRPYILINHERGTGLYKFTSTCVDDEKNALLLIYRYVAGIQDDTYIVLQYEHINDSDQTKMRSNIKVQCIEGYFEQPNSILTVNAKRGTAFLFPSYKSSDKVLQEILKTAQEFIDHHQHQFLLEHTKQQGYKIRWKDNRYVITPL